MSYGRFVFGFAFAFSLLLFGGIKLLFLTEDMSTDTSTRFEMAPFNWIDYLSDQEMKVLAQRLRFGRGHGAAEMVRRQPEFQRPEVYKPFLEERLGSDGSSALQVEIEFMKFGLLRQVAKKVTLRWYEPEEIDLTVWAYVPDDTKLRTHEIVDEEDLTQWLLVLSTATVIRRSSELPFYSPASSPTHPGVPSPHDAIVFETDKEEIVIGFGGAFHLGERKGNTFSHSRLFYSPQLAILLDDYVKKHILEHFPPIHVDELSGKNNMQRSIEWYQQQQKE